MIFGYMDMLALAGISKNKISVNIKLSYDIAEMTQKAYNHTDTHYRL